MDELLSAPTQRSSAAWSQEEGDRLQIHHLIDSRRYVLDLQVFFKVFRGNWGFVCNLCATDGKCYCSIESLISNF